MAKISAGIALYRRRSGQLQILLVHAGGPYWMWKDVHAWSIPKGEVMPGEALETAARREFSEETGAQLPGGPMQALPVLQISRGKVLHPFACEGDFDPTQLRSNTFDLEWPPQSGQIRTFPEVDKAAWFTLAEAREKLHKGQATLVDLLENALQTT